MNASYDQQISGFLRTHVNKALVDHYDPGQNLVRHIAASADESLLPDFLNVVVDSRSSEVAPLFGDRASNEEIVYADALDTVLVSGGLTKLLGINKNRQRAVERYVNTRAKLLASAIVQTAAEEKPELFDEDDMPIALKGYTFIAQVVALVAHAHTATDGSNSMQMRKNGLPFWTHPFITANFIDEANAYANIDENLGMRGTEQIVAGAHDGYEDGMTADSSHWLTLPTIVSPLVVSHVATQTGADNPNVAGITTYLMTRTHDADGIRMSYGQSYIPRGIGKNITQNTTHIAAQKVFRKAKPGDNAANINDPVHPLKRRISIDYADAFNQMRQTTQPGTNYDRYLDKLEAFTIDDRDRLLAAVQDYDALATIERAEHYFNISMKKVV